MIKRKHWHRLPSRPVLDALPQLSWGSGETSAARDAAALMVYVSLAFMAQREYLKPDTEVSIAAATYDALTTATGLSRQMISLALSRLAELQLIQKQGSPQNRRYLLTGSEGYWFKLPCLALIGESEIRPFQHFKLRSKVELYALKLYLYLAARRDNDTLYSMSSRETIAAATGIPERHVRRARSFLVSCGLLDVVTQKYNEYAGKNEPTRYYLLGHAQLVRPDLQAA
ncbi:MAG TPA: helix-turn-helix domain-containing protein [Usitatibacter sp.]|nr:helix-turn-helix domain-containing protein [Usitatibacter sp.]